MKSIILAITLLASTAASAEPLVIAAGKPGGGYDKASQALSQRLQQRNTDSAIVNYNGSDEITLSLCSKHSDIGFAQIDAIYARGLEGCALTPLGLYGHEYATIWFPPDSPYDELEDLGPDNTILIDTVGSGTDLFWHTIVGIENNPDYGNGSEWAQAGTINDTIDLAPTLAEIGDIDAVILVRKPDSRDLAGLDDNGWERGWLYDKDINDVVVNGKSLYDTADGSSAYEIRTFLVAGPNFDKSLTRVVQQSLK